GRFDGDAWLPTFQRAVDTLFNQMSRCDIVRLEKEVGEACAKIRQANPLAKVGQQRHADRFTDIFFAFRPNHSAIRPNAWGETQAAAEDCARCVHVCLPFKPGMGKQILKNGSQKKTMFKRLTKMIKRISAQIVIIGIENEQI